MAEQETAAGNEASPRADRAGREAAGAAPGAQEESTIYRDMDPETIARKFWSADYLVDLVAMVGLGLVIVAAAWMANMGQVWGFAIAAVIVVVVFTFLNARRMRNFAELQGILMVDCDARKMEQVCVLSAKRTKGGAERVRFRILHGMSLALQGKAEEALDMVDGMYKLQLADELNVRSVRACAYRMSGDIAALEALVEEVQSIHDRLPEGNPLKGAAAYLAAQIDFSIALARGDWGQAQKALEHVEGQAAAPERLVEASYAHALLDDARGDVEDARKHFEEVAAKGGTLAICDKARDWLDSHPKPRLSGQAGQ